MDLQGWHTQWKQYDVKKCKLLKAKLNLGKYEKGGEFSPSSFSHQLLCETCPSIVIQSHFFLQSMYLRKVQSELFLENAPLTQFLDWVLEFRINSFCPFIIL